MSHQATTWAFAQRGISPAAKVVLYHLANRHNPDYGCFPSQQRLADDAEISRSSLNNHLRTLEKAGLIRRVRRVDRTKGQMKSTRYILGFEETEAQEPCLKTGHGQDVDKGVDKSPPVSKNDASPCPNSEQNRVQNLDTNPIRESIRESVTDGETELSTISMADAEKLQFYADWVNGDKYLPQNAISRAMVADLARARLVSAARLAERDLL